MITAWVLSVFYTLTLGAVSTTLRLDFWGPTGKGYETEQLCKDAFGQYGFSTTKGKIRLTVVEGVVTDPHAQCIQVQVQP